ncbi:MAG TPA: HisA/HisF family protein [Methanothermococcus okinawensis]|uniref:HisA/HisF family protein n=1 Tax=Methanothermococcus okinawensis TaxID=155863 RepID=A0A832YSB6_9EURY|nr:HisA/HisF family protein [Methanothermococcus okinawensis]
MKIIPVIDILNNMAVHGKGGDRENYKPLKTVLCNSSNPIDVAKKYREEGAEKIYIADLDAIMKKGNNFHIIRKINGYKILDIGITTKLEIENLKSLNICNRIILGTETLRDLDLLNRRDIILSLDFKEDKLLSPMNYNLEEILNRLDKTIPLIVLNISSVGTQKGIDWVLIREIINKTDNPIYVGGGIRDEGDLKECHNLGIQGVLLGTVIHKGILNLREIIERYR